jgi:long-chain acyl-CoA synthetase
MGQIFSPIVEAKGGELALADEFGETTWAEFDERVNRLLNALRDAGVRTGDTIGILSGNRREYYEAMAAASQGGLRYVPINWHWVGEEIAYVLENSEAKALIADERFASVAQDAIERLPANHLALACVIAADPVGELASYEQLLAAASPEDPPEQGLGGPMFYTSGTTGRPKGVVNSAFSLGGNVAIMPLIGKGLAASMQLPEGGRTLLEGPVYHSAQWAFSYLPLLAGNAVVMRHKFDSAETLELIDRYAITNIHMVPTQFVRMLRLDDDIRASFDGKSLAVVWHGAAPCPQETKRQMLDWWGDIIWEYYGSTEGSIISTISPDDWRSHPKSVGKPVASIEVRVVKDDGSIASASEEGQLYFKNQSGSDFSYHKDEDKTKAAHLEPGVFTTGDVGYLDEDGFLYMSDRKIDMIISGGVNIYPAEIEGVLTQHRAVADAAVFGIPNEEFGEEVKAAVELCDGVEASDALADELIALCREHLAGYKTPRSIDFEQNLPRHPTGKLYKRLLREPYWKDTGRSI